MVSPLGVVPKRNGKFRLIVDLRYLNSHISAPRFRYEDINDLATVIRDTDLTYSIDFCSGFHHISIRQEDRDLLGFSWRGIFYIFNVLPFGLSLSPWLFTRMTRPALAYLRSKSHRMAMYMDDLLGCVSPHQSSQLLECIDLFTRLGWIIEPTKSKLTLSTSTEWLGYRIDTADATRGPALFVTSKKRQEVTRQISYVLRNYARPFSARFMARIAGLCTSLSRCVLAPTRMLLRNLHRDIQRAAMSSWSTTLILSPAAISDLRLWLQSLKEWSGVRLIPKPIDLVLYTDASDAGYGAHFKQPTQPDCSQSIHGQWSAADAQTSINFRELKAVLLALQQWAPLWQDRQVRLRTDNATTVAYVNGFGGKHLHLDSLGRSIQLLCSQHSIRLSAEHIAGSSNILADHLSRLTSLPSKHEWSIRPQVFRRLDNLWGPHTLDRFASAQNTQLPRYNSRMYDGQCTAIDAFTQDWATETNWLVPPIRLIAKTLLHLRACRASGTIIVPHWPRQTWWPLLQEIATAPPIWLSQRDVWHPNPQAPIEPNRFPSWRLTAWKVCGSITQSRPAGHQTTPNF